MIEGWLTKYVQKVKLLQITLQPKRFFSIDFEKAQIFIKKEAYQDVNDKNVKAILFRDILDCNIPKPSKNEASTSKYVFTLKTSSREFILAAKSDADRTLWIAAFKYIIATTSTVQEIMRANDQKQVRKMRDTTRAFSGASLKNTKALRLQQRSGSTANMVGNTVELNAVENFGSDT